MTLSTSTIRPGLLVGLKTSVTGNVSYAKQVLADERDENGALVARWETERRIEDPAEHETAAQVRSKARAQISSICANTAFGLLCPEDKVEYLERAIVEARRLIETFNATAKLTRINLYVITGRIAPDDVEAARAISSEVRDLLSLMEGGIQKLDVEAVRAAANRARSVAQMLAPGSQQRVQEAVDAARAAARRIVKAGEQAAQEIDKEAIAAVAKVRTSLLDYFDEVPEVAAPAVEGRAVDFSPAAPIEAPAMCAAKIEVE